MNGQRLERWWQAYMQARVLGDNPEVAELKAGDIVEEFYELFPEAKGEAEGKYQQVPLPLEVSVPKAAMVALAEEALAKKPARYRGRRRVFRDNGLSGPLHDLLAKHRVSMRQLAESAGVSDQTVRRAIKEPEMLAVEYLAKIVVAARKLDRTVTGEKLFGKVYTEKLAGVEAK